MVSDIRFALRQLLKYPGYTVVAVLTLALGIGVNTTMFSVLNTLVLHASAAPESDRLMMVMGTSGQSQDRLLSPGDFYDYQTQNKSFDQLGSYDQTNFNLSEPGQPAQRLNGMSVTGNFFQVFGIRPELGRVITPEEDREGGGRVAVVSDGFWRSHFAADPAVIGRTLRMDGEQVSVVGVMPAEFDNLTYWGHVDLWQSLSLDGGARRVRDNAWLRGIGRLRPGVTAAQAGAEASAIADRIAHDFPLSDAGNGLRLVSWNAARTSDVSRNISWMCMSLAGFVLLIACANLANLQLARVTERVRENAVRIALGASRMQIIRQRLVESVVLSAIGGLVGVLVATWGTKMIGGAIYIADVRGVDLPINTGVLAFTIVVSAVTGIAVGTFPAWIASRADVNAALKQGSRGTTGDGSRHLVRQVLIVTELVLALVLLAGAGFFVRGAQRMASADMGWRPDGLTVASMSLPYNASYQTDEACQAFFDKLSVKMDGLPGTQHATISTYLPISGFWRSSGITIQDRPPLPHGKEPKVYFNSETPGNIPNLGMRIIRGRDFAASDRADTVLVAVINETMARDLWPGENPIGKRIADSSAKLPRWIEVVGIVSDVHPTLELVRLPETPFQVHLPLAQTQSTVIHWFNVAIRSTAPQPTVAAGLRAAVQQIDPDQPVYDIYSARDAMAQITVGFVLTGKMLGAFALIGLALSAVGIFGVIANLVAQRTSEFGIRMALGAQAGDVLWLVLGQGLRLVGLGTAIGLACAWGLVRALVAIVPGVHGGDPLALAGVAVLLAAVATLACWLPARRATKVDPIIALRAE
jgi:putative ABC transport system permease protein